MNGQFHMGNMAIGTCPCERGQYCKYCGHCVQGHWPEELPAIVSRCHYPGCECRALVGEPLEEHTVFNTQP